MKNHLLWLTVPLAFLIIALASTIPKLQEQQRQKLKEEQLHYLARRIERCFTSIRPLSGKVMLAPAPMKKELVYNNDLYVLSPPEKDYWHKPRLVGKGFEFGYFDGAKYYEYKVIKIQSDGLLVIYNESGGLPGVHPRLLLNWK